MKKSMKITLGVVTGVLALGAIAMTTALCIWNNEISTVSSIKMILDENKENKSAPVYSMEVKGDYYFDKFLKQGGCSNDSELIDFIVSNITKGVIPVKMSAPEIGCSSFTAVDENGHNIFGRNYDFTTTTSMIVKTNPGKGRYASISSVDLQFLGIDKGQHLDSLMQKVTSLAATYAPLDGINEKGVSCGIYMTYQGPEGNVVATNQQTDKPDLTSTTMLRMILDYAANVDEAVEMVSKYDLHDSANTSFHYMVADASGKSAILEWVGENDSTDTDGTKRELKVYYNDDDSVLGTKEGDNRFQHITNFVLTPNYYNSDDEKKGLDRYLEIENQINPDGNNNNGTFSKEQSMNLLKTVGRRKWDSRNGESDANHITVWSALYDLTDKKVTWVSNEEFDNEKAIFVNDFSYLK